MLQANAIALGYLHMYPAVSSLIAPVIVHPECSLSICSATSGRRHSLQARFAYGKVPAIGFAIGKAS